jgi:acetyltransferase-like isoleucine patch superfamily enzyme
MSRPSKDPLSLVSRILSRLYTLWLVWTYPFVSVGKNFWAHYSCDLRRPVASHIKIGNSVALDRDVWLNIPAAAPGGNNPVIVIEDGCKVGRRCMISAKNSVHIERNVIFSPSVLVMDHNHAFEDVTVPILAQGVTKGGAIRINEGCWIGYGVAIVCGHGELVIGKNSVIGANSVVTRSVPPGSVVTGNPARVVKRFDPSKGEWVLGLTGVAASTREN